MLYAGSLVNLMTKQVGPAFQKASGYSVNGEGAGSTALVTDIKGKIDKGDVFISASPTATKTLMGTSNGDWVSWYVSYASSNVVLGYNPKSKFANGHQDQAVVPGDHRARPQARLHRPGNRPQGQAGRPGAQ